MRRFAFSAARAFTTTAGGGKSRAVARGSLLLRCPDSLGIVSSIADRLLKHNSNLTATDLHVESHVKFGGALHDVFVCRFVFEYKENELDHLSLETNLATVVEKYHADATLAFHSGYRVEMSADFSSRKFPRRLVRESGNLRMGVLVSNKEHCLVDLINRFLPPLLRPILNSEVHHRHASQRASFWPAIALHMSSCPHLLCEMVQEAIWGVGCGHPVCDQQPQQRQKQRPCPVQAHCSQATFDGFGLHCLACSQKQRCNFSTIIGALICSSSSSSSSAADSSMFLISSS